MTLKEQVQSDLIAAMKAGDEVKKNALRMLKAAIMKFEVDGEKKEADDDVILGIVMKEIKQRQDAAEAFSKGGNTDKAADEEAEAAILMAYMPAQMSEEEVRKVVAEELEKAGISTKADMGKAMGAVMPRLKGKANGKLINQVVASMLK